MNLLKGIKVDQLEASGMEIETDLEIGSIHYRSQDVKPRGMFVAVPGLKADGHDFIDEALKKGAAVILTQKKVKKDIVVISVKNTRKALADISSRFFGRPSESLFIIAVTGTNGKTTTAYLIESILVKAGFNTGVIGTINYRYCGKTFKNLMTTPESLDLQSILAEMLKAGITHVVMEVSSHAIDLYRIESCLIDIGVFTNLSRDHLDYHKNMDSYWSCKKKMFTENLKSDSKKNRKDLTAAVINCDDPRGRELFNILPGFVLSTGFSAKNMIRPERIKYDLGGIEGTILTPQGSFEFKSALIGEHNLHNILSATGVSIGMGISLSVIKAGIHDLFFVPGRLERISGNPDNKDKFIFVDYAHTPDALWQALNTLKSAGQGKIICIFGCGGDRDKEKRPLMGEIAGKLSDLAIITSDNPRSENPMQIIDQIAAGLKKVSSKIYASIEVSTGFQQKGYVKEPDRKQAILTGIQAAGPGDMVLIAGKGHETYQIIGTKTIEFDDRQEARQALTAIKDGRKQK